MRLLLDTNALLWWIADAPRLGAAAREAIAAPETSVAVSAVSAFEIATKRAIGKLTFDGDLETELERNAFEPLAVTVPHAFGAGALPMIHRDPFDRILVAQASLEHRTLVTADTALARYGIAVLAA